MEQLEINLKENFFRLESPAWNYRPRFLGSIWTQRNTHPRSTIEATIISIDIPSSLNCVGKLEKFP